MPKPSFIDPVVMMSACALSQAIHARAVSCEHVMRSYLDHIELHNPRVNAIISMRPRDELMAEARDRDVALAEGAVVGWMHGFPAAVKDLDSVRGLPWTQGSPLYATHIAAKDSIQAERMRASGCIFIGKTNTPEFGLGSQTYNKVFGATLNPYDESRTAGGSSGGAAAALALRMLPVTDGSDHAGSLRNPAAFNNCYSLRPSFGRIPDESTDVFSTSLGVVGPMARTGDDLAMMLSVQAGPDDRAPLSIDQSGQIYADLVGRPQTGLAGRRIAWLGNLGGYLPLEDGVADLCLRGLGVFESLGCSVEAVDLEFPIEQVWENWLILRASLMSHKLGPLYGNPQQRDLLKPEAVWEVENGLRLTPQQIGDAVSFRTRWFNEVRRLHQQYDALVLPSAQVFPFPVEQHWPKQIAGRAMDTYHRWMEVVIPGTMSGCPIAGVPCGFNADGLPMGMQMIFPMHREIDALSFVRAYDAANPLPTLHLPPALTAASASRERE